MTRSPNTLSDTSCAFSLTELVAVMAIVAIATTLVVPAFRGVTATSVSSAVQRTHDMLSEARSEAIVRQAPCRVAIVTKWEQNPEAVYRAITLWKANPERTTGWEQITNWNYLPKGAVFEPDEPISTVPTYNGSAPQFLFDSTLSNTFTQTLQGEDVEMRYIEFLPNGSARTAGALGGANLWVRIVEGHNQGATIQTLKNSPNCADIVTDGLIGRVKTYRP